MHAVKLESGRILVYEDWKRDVVSQVDFQWDVKIVKSDQLELWALELGISILLLPEYCGEGTRRRVGVAWDVREDYFALAQCKTLILR